MNKTHWKKVVSDPNYLGEADFEAGEEKIATIARVVDNEIVQTAEGKSKKAVVYFQENLKPMILNVARSKAIEKVARSPYFEDWPGVSIQLYIDHNVKAFGDVVAAVRVRPTKPTIRKAVRCADCGREIRAAAGKSAEYMESYTKKKFGVPLCFECGQLRAQIAKGVQEVMEEETVVQEGGSNDGQTEIDS